MFDQDQNSLDERRQAGQRQGGQAGDQEGACCQHRSHLLHTTVVGDETGSLARHQESGDQEQRRGRDAVIDHVQRGAGCPWLVITKMPRMMKPKWLIEV